MGHDHLSRVLAMHNEDGVTATRNKFGTKKERKKLRYITLIVTRSVHFLK